MVLNLVRKYVYILSYIYIYIYIYIYTVQTPKAYIAALAWRLPGHSGVGGSMIGSYCSVARKCC